MDKILAALAMFIALFAVDMSQASIVNDPAALADKLEEMRVVRMAKQKAKDAYWADYRKNQEAYQVERCTRVYTTTGTYRKCKMTTDYKYTGTMEYPR